MATPPSPARTGLLALAFIGGGLALVATFFVAGEDHLPGSFFIDRQAMWNGGTYYVKFTFMAVLLTLANFVALPLIVFFGAKALISPTQRAGAVEPPPSWDVAQMGRRVRQTIVLLVCVGLWLPFTLAAIFAPEKLSFLGFVASTALIFIPIVPMLGAAVLFDVLAAPQYVEGTITSLQIVRDRNNHTAHVMIGDENFQMPPARVTGLAQGMRAGLIVSGFFGTVLRIEKRA